METTTEDLKQQREFMQQHNLNVACRESDRQPDSWACWQGDRGIALDNWSDEQDEKYLSVDDSKNGAIKKFCFLNNIQIPKGMYFV